MRAVVLESLAHHQNHPKSHFSVHHARIGFLGSRENLLGELISIALYVARMDAPRSLER